MNNYEQIIKQLVEASPSWEKDGGGVRGRTIAPIISGLSSSGGIAEFIPQQFNQNNNETIQKSAQDPVADLIFGGGGGGGGSTCSSLGLYFKTDENDNTTLWITSGVINGTPIAEQEIANSDSGFVLARTIINESQGTVVESGVITESQTPTDTLTTFYFPIGFYDFTNNIVRQDHCGTIFGYSCRVQYSSPARFSWRYYS